MRLVAAREERLPDSADTGRLGRNLGFLYAAEILGRVAAFAVFPFLASTLGDARYGDLEFAIGVFFILNLVLDAGLAPYGAREAAREPDKTRRLVGQIAVLRLGILVLAVGVLAAVAWWAEPRRGEDVARLVLAYACVLAPGPLLLNWVFEARDEMHVVAGASLLRQLVFAAGVFALVRGPDEAVRVPLAEALGLGLAVAMQIILVRRRLGPLRPWRQLAGTMTVLREALPMAGSTVLWAVRVFTPLFVIWGMVGSSTAGVFGAALRLVVSAHAFVWLYFVNLLPSMSRMAQKPGELSSLLGSSMRLVGLVALPGAAASLVLGPLVVSWLYDERFVAAGPTLAVLAWWLAFAFISGHHRYALIAVRRPTLEFVAALVGATVSVVGCILLGADLAPSSAAVVLASAELSTLVAAAGYCRFAGVNVPIRPLVVPIAVAATMVAAWFAFLGGV